ncbi:DUF29 domain-containing protein [Nodosilinea sp. LEGE 07088]|uniref:DUF29 domain-containing protein n=1 Tax=Nodosilinea sp. LEGE 07088 TaxID=2777968 RepID=UPI00187ED53D|nr:DUF29 domain-containing protein [Nodosilinea sp. LEGE 07088]MBE9136870.1 DUF29 domain-containing protein [Nodosilinea sp. LEGE 07088]
MPKTPLQTPLPQLYDEDFVRWVEATVACLKRRDTEHLDWNGLIEEIEDLGKSAKRELESRLSVLLVHLLKRCHVDLPDDYRGWQLTILEQRNALKRLLKQSPSLKGYFEAVLEEIYQDALAEAIAAYPTSTFPTAYPFSPDLQTLLTDDPWS